MIIIDEILVRKLKDYSTDVISIRNDYPGITDRNVIEVAKTNKGVVVTEDKDFGELIFSYNIRGCSVMLLRYGKSDLETIEHNLFKALNYFEKRHGHYFLTVTDKKKNT